MVLPLPPTGMDPNAVPDGEPEYPGRPQPESVGTGSRAALSVDFLRFLFASGGYEETVGLLSLRFLSLSLLPFAFLLAVRSLKT